MKITFVAILIMLVYDVWLQPIQQEHKSSEMAQGTKKLQDELSGHDLEKFDAIGPMRTTDNFVKELALCEIREPKR